MHACMYGAQQWFSAMVFSNGAQHGAIHACITPYGAHACMSQHPSLFPRAPTHTSSLRSGISSSIGSPVLRSISSIRIPAPQRAFDTWEGKKVGAVGVQGGGMDIANACMHRRWGWGLGEGRSDSWGRAAWKARDMTSNDAPSPLLHAEWHNACSSALLPVTLSMSCTRYLRSKLTVQRRLGLCWQSEH